MTLQRRNTAATARIRTVRDIRLLVATLAQSARSVERSTGMTNAQLFVLRQLAARHGLTINELAELAMTQQSAMSLLVSRLERTGHVRRVRSKDDRRHIEVELTVAGRRIAAKAPPPPLERVLLSLRRLSDGDVRALQRGLDRLLAEMGAQRARAPFLFEPEGRRKPVGRSQKG